MSYDIMYNSICIKSVSGFTPVILSGSNNTYDCTKFGKSGRRARSWNCYANFAGVSSEEFLAEIETHMGSAYQEHWVRHGHWVDDAGVRRWAKKMLANARSIEDVLAYNGLPCAMCYSEGWDDSGHFFRSNTILVKTTKDLDNWIVRVKGDGRKPFLHIHFGDEKLRTPVADGSIVKIQGNTGYFVKSELRQNQKMVFWTQEKKNAAVFRKEEAEDIVMHRLVPLYGKAWCVKA